MFVRQAFAVRRDKIPYGLADFAMPVESEA